MCSRMIVFVSERALCLFLLVTTMLTVSIGARRSQSVISNLIPYELWIIERFLNVIRNSRSSLAFPNLSSRRQNFLNASSAYLFLYGKPNWTKVYRKMQTFSRSACSSRDLRTIVEKSLFNTRKSRTLQSRNARSY